MAASEPDTAADCVVSAMESWESSVCEAVMKDSGNQLPETVREHGDGNHRSVGWGVD
jgi:hypothetical protein